MSLLDDANEQRQENHMTRRLKEVAKKQISAVLKDGHTAHAHQLQHFIWLGVLFKHGLGALLCDLVYGQDLHCLVV